MCFLYIVYLFIYPSPSTLSCYMTEKCRKKGWYVLESRILNWAKKKMMPINENKNACYLDIKSESIQENSIETESDIVYSPISLDCIESFESMEPIIDFTEESFIQELDIPEVALPDKICTSQEFIYNADPIEFTNYANERLCNYYTQINKPF
jgi:hypothetical protein